MRLGRWLLLAGGILLVVASVGLMVHGSAPAHAFETMIVKIGEPLPAALGQLAYFALWAGLLALGWIVSCAGVSWPSRTQHITPAGRALYASAGIATAVSAMPAALGVWSLRTEFYILATSEAAPSPAVLLAAIKGSRTLLHAGFAVSGLAALLVVLVACAGFRTCEPGHRATSAWLAPTIVTCLTVFWGLAFTLSAVLVWRHGVSLAAIMADASSTPRAAELAARLSGILNASLIGFVLLFLLGSTQILAAVLPRRGQPTGRST